MNLHQEGRRPTDENGMGSERLFLQEKKAGFVRQLEQQLEFFSTKFGNERVQQYAKLLAAYLADLKSRDAEYVFAEEARVKFVTTIPTINTVLIELIGKDRPEAASLLEQALVPLQNWRDHLMGILDREAFLEEIQAQSRALLPK